MTTGTLRKQVVKGLEDKGYRKMLEGPTGEYFVIGDARTADHMVWVGWPFEPKPLRVEYILANEREKFRYSHSRN